MDLKEAVQHKRFILDLIEDPDIAVCKYNIGKPKQQADVASLLTEIVSRHVAKLQAEIKDAAGKVKVSNFLCQFSCKAR
jgi:hypothetical protein